MGGFFGWKKTTHTHARTQISVGRPKIGKNRITQKREFLQKKAISQKRELLQGDGGGFAGRGRADLRNPPTFKWTRLFRDS